MDWKKLSVCQERAASGEFAAAASGFVQWLSNRLHDVQQEMRNQRFIQRGRVLRWQKEPEFQAAYRAARRAAHAQSVARLQQATSAAVSTLLKIMVDATAPHSTRVPAADSVLDHAAKAIEIEDIEARVSELETAAGLSKPG